MMISGLMKKISTIVRLIPFCTSSVVDLFLSITKTICEIESCDLFVEVFCTDNYPLNVTLFIYFHMTGKSYNFELYIHITHLETLFYFFDIVLIIKLIRNIWLNLKDFEKNH